MRSISIRAGLKADPLVEDIERNKMRWYGHVMKMGEESITKNVGYVDLKETICGTAKKEMAG